MKLHELTIQGAHQLLKKKEISSEELTRAILGRINDVDSQVDAFVTVVEEMAMEQAKEADRQPAALQKSLKIICLHMMRRL
jgi:aspartyl-tRNA(Asn)/glutamyl-tRNA(Gln) amidotransferase subunit A